jgi:predicted metal-dependent phosphoesterase TrpH
MLKVDLHTHTGDDPVDSIPYSTRELIDRAAALGFDALAITLHDRQLDVSGELSAYASQRGIVLIPGVERTLAGRHILLLNFPSVTESLQTFDDVAALKARYPKGLVIAPHPFFPHANCLREHMDRLADLFDAVEFNAFYTSALDFNRRGMRWADRHGKPRIGNSDTHRLPLLGRTYSLIGAEPTPDAICAAVKAGRTEIRTEPISLREAALYFASLSLAGMTSRRPMRRRPAAVPRPAGTLT